MYLSELNAFFFWGNTICYYWNKIPQVFVWDAMSGET